MWIRVLPVALCLVCGIATPGTSGDLPKTIKEIVQVELLPGWRKADGTHVAALSFDLAKGWKTYWRSPGDGGLPTHLDHGGSRNVDALHILWPRPEVFRVRGMRSIGYRDSVVLPLHLEPHQQGEIDLNLTLDFGICEDVCIPVRMTFKHRLPDSTVARDPQIETALAQLPVESDYAMSCSFHAKGDQAELTVNLHAPPLPGRGEAVVIETGAPDVWVSEPSVERDGASITATAQMTAEGPSFLPPDRNAVRVTLISSQAAKSFQGCSGF